MNHHELAEMQGGLDGTAKAQVSRGIGALRDFLKPDNARLREVTM